MKRLLLCLLLCLTMITGMSFAEPLAPVIAEPETETSAEPITHWTTFAGPLVIDDTIVDNQQLAWPFLTDGSTIYMPLDWYTLRVLGYLSYWDESSETLIVYDTSNKLTKFRQKKEGFSEPLPPAIVTAAKLSWMQDDITLGDQPIINKGGVLYVPLTDAVVEKVEWAANTHPVLGFRLATDPDKYTTGFETAELNYVDAMARFMMSRNKALAYETARSYVTMVRRAATTYEVDELWIMAMLWQESWYKADTEYKGAIGLMQIMESTGRSLGLSRSQLFDPETSITYGVKYLKQHVDMYDGDLEKATLAYNQGSTRVNKGTYKVWYLNQVQEKYDVIKTWIAENQDE